MKTTIGADSHIMDAYGKNKYCSTMSLELNMNKQHLNTLPVIKPEFTDNVN